MRIRSITCQPWDVELTEPFGIATGAQVVARNVLVRVTLDDGAVGLGEAAPFPAVNGETQEQVLGALASAAESLAGLSLDRTEAWSRAVFERFSPTPSAVAAVEMAVVDALCRARGSTLWEHFGAAVPHLQTDITIPTGGPEAAAEAALRAVQGGFRTLKIKVGGVPFEHDVARLRAISAVAPRSRLLLDANASLSGEQAVSLVESLKGQRHQVVLFEQPCARQDFAGARAVRAAGIRVAADEDARSGADVELLRREDAADVVNLKVTKCGLHETLRMLDLARRCGFGLMMGGMVETRLAMTVSACIAAGYGGFEEIDLDTPLFLKDDRLSGGFLQEGPSLRLDQLGAGHGVSLAAGQS